MLPVSGSVCVLDASISLARSVRMNGAGAYHKAYAAICGGLSPGILTRSEPKKPIKSDATIEGRLRSLWSRCRRRRLEKSYFTVFEELDLAETFLRLFERLVWPAEVLPLARQYLVASRNFLDHDAFSPFRSVTLPTNLAIPRTTGGVSCLRLPSHPCPAE